MPDSKKNLIIVASVFVVVIVAVVIFLVTSPKVPNPSTLTAIDSISIQAPPIGSLLSLPFTIQGQAKIAENQFTIKLVDPINGATLFEQTVPDNSSNAETPFPYQASVNQFTQTPKSRKLMIEVVTGNPADPQLITSSQVFLSS